MIERWVVHFENVLNRAWTLEILKTDLMMAMNENMMNIRGPKRTSNDSLLLQHFSSSHAYGHSQFYSMNWNHRNRTWTLFNKLKSSNYGNYKMACHEHAYSKRCIWAKLTFFPYYTYSGNLEHICEMCFPSRPTWQALFRLHFNYFN